MGGSDLGSLIEVAVKMLGGLNAILRLWDLLPQGVKLVLALGRNSCREDFFRGLIEYPHNMAAGCPQSE